jgi:ABC-type ATPase involved in cell division
MTIDRLEIKDFMVFKGDFAVDFCPGVNVIIGSNGTGKTTLLRKLYNENTDCVYIPEKDILEHAKGLLTFIEQKQTGFSQIYKNVLINAQDIPTRVQSETQQKVGKMIADIIGGEVHWDKGEGSFYTLRTDGVRIPFASEASGYKKLGFLGLLVASGQLEKGAVLLWDEPENSLNPELMPVLVDILLELQRGGVQIFIATHNEILASYFAVNRQEGDKMMFHSLYKEGEHIEVNSNDRFDLLEPNKLTEEPVKLYEKELDKVLGDD